MTWYRTGWDYAALGVAEHEQRRLTRLRAAIAGATTADRAELQKLFDKATDDDYREHLVDVHLEIGEVEGVADGALIVALHRIVEIARTSIIAFNRTKQESEEQRRSSIRSLHKIAAVTKLLQSEFGIAHDSITQAREIDELRRLNNAWKHSGFVDADLAGAFATYGREGELLQGLGAALDKLEPSVRPYLAELIERLRSARPR